MSRRVDQLINDVEIFYTDTFESGNRARAMKRLRVPPLEEKQSPAVTFRVGLFVGMFLFSRKQKENPHDISHRNALFITSNCHCTWCTAS